MSEKKCLYCRKEMPRKVTPKGVLEAKLAYQRRSYCSSTCSNYGKRDGIESVADQIDNFVPFKEVARMPWRKV